jgi:uncharacterized phage protein (TIGR01671 family)
MNNRFKFRVWSTKYKKFLGDDYFLDLTGRVRMLDYDYLDKEEDVVVQQYTGFLDRNDKEIYEGDILKGNYYKWDAIEFMNGKFVANLRGGRVYDLCELFDYVVKGDYPEVIGNIFENPELLNV